MPEIAIAVIYIIIGIFLFIFSEDENYFIPFVWPMILFLSYLQWLRDKIRN